MKLMHEADKDKLVIFNDGGRYKFLYNSDATFKWSGFKKKKLKNKITKEEVKYGDLMLLQNKAGKFFLYPNTLEDITGEYNQYELDQWKFVGDVDLLGVDNDEKIVKLEETVSVLAEAVNKLVGSQVGVIEGGMGLKGMKEQMKVLKEIQSTLTDILNGKHITIRKPEPTNVIQDPYSQHKYPTNHSENGMTTNLQPMSHQYQPSTVSSPFNNMTIPMVESSSINSYPQYTVSQSTAQGMIYNGGIVDQTQGNTYNTTTMTYKTTW